MSSTGDLRLRGMFGTGFVTFQWQDDGSTDEEILETMRMSVLDLDEVKNILETKIREYKQQAKSFECMKTLCNNFNKIIDTLLSLWKGTHRLHELHQFPSVTFLEHVMDRCYKNCVRNSSSLQVFDKKTFLIIDAVFKHFQLTEDDVLTEINTVMGSRSVVLQMAASGSFRCCYGILPKTDSTSESEHIAAEFTKWMEFYGKDYTEFQLYHEDLTSNEMLKVVSDSTVIFLKDLNLGSEMESKISLVFSQLNEGSRIISLENCSQLFAFRDRTVDVQECTTGRSDVTYYLHVVKTRSSDDTDSKMESLSLSSSLTDVQKKQELPLTPSPSTSSTQTGFKAPGITNDVHKVSLLSSEAQSSLIASLDNILSCYRNQFIKFIEFMQTKEYRLQLGEAVKEELLHKTELKNKIQSLLLQINELNGSSPGSLHRQPGVGSGSDGDVLAEVRTVVTYNRQLKILETLLKNEISQLEQKKPVQDDLLGLNHKGLLRKAGDCYKKYIQLKEKAKDLEAEVAILEGKTEISSVLDRHGSTRSSVESSAVKSIVPTEDVVRQCLLEFGTDASGTRPTSSLLFPKNRPHSDQHSGVVPFSKCDNFQCPKDVDTDFYRSDLHSSTSGESLRVLFGSNGRMEGLMSSLNNDHGSDLSGIRSSGLANRRGSSSSTDTAESGQGPKYGAQNVDGNSISSWPNSPETLQPVASRFPDRISKSQQVVRSAMEHRKPLIESVDVRVPHAYPGTQSQSEGMTMPEVVVPVTGKGKQATGKRGRRKRATADVDDGTCKPVLGKRGKLAPLLRTDSDTGWKERDNEMKQEALLKGRDLALGFHQGIQRPEEHSKPLKSNGTRTTKTDIQKAQDAGNLDALLLAVSLHHLPPSHRNLGQDLAPITAKMLKEPLMHHGVERFSSASFLPMQLGSSSVMRATVGKLPFTDMSWSLPQVSDSKPCVTMQDNMDDKQMETMDDSHGKHFKKRCHSTNFKHSRAAKKIGETAAAAAADSPNPINEATAMPILKSLFSKRNDNANRAPVHDDVDQPGVDKRPIHLPTDSQLTTIHSSNALKISSGGLTIGTTGVNQTSSVVFPQSELSRYMSAPCPSAPPLTKQLQALSWFSLPLSLVRQMTQSDASLAAKRQPSESDKKLLSQSMSVYSSVSDHRTVTSSSVASNIPASSGTIGPRRDRHKALTKSSSR